MAAASSIKLTARATCKKCRKCLALRHNGAEHGLTCAGMSRHAFRALRGLAMVCLAIALGGAVSACNRSNASSDAANGEPTFASICARCHGSDGKGGVPAAEGANAPRNFCDAAFQAARTDEQLKAVIRKGKGGMPAFGNLFSDVELQGLVHKIRSFNPGAKGS
jgi:mono/diheme cytochrome c family protein